MNKPLLIHILIISFVLFSALINLAAGKQKDRILVIPLKAQKGIDQKDAEILTGMLSVEMQRSGRFTALYSGDMKFALNEKEFEHIIECDDNKCLLEDVVKLSVDKLIVGSIEKVGEKFIVSVRMINEHGENEISETDYCECPIDELSGLIKRISSKILSYDGEAATYSSSGLESGPEKSTIHFAPVQNELQGHSDPAKGMEFVLVKGGCFDMGDIFGDGDDDEKPVHKVCLDDFYIGKYEVTNQQFVDFLNDVNKRGSKRKPWFETKEEAQSSHITGKIGHYHVESGYENYPVIEVSWYGAVACAEWMSVRTGRNYRLPTEAEWEYAARSGGKREKWSGTNTESELGDYGWYADNSEGKWYDKKTHPVGLRKPNGLGIFDMSGNIWEWCSDLYNSEYYKNSPEQNPVALPAVSGSFFRIYRGGSWINVAEGLRTTYRNSYKPDVRVKLIGFRMSMSP
jgi:formylglycine-generating enzyme required for sulfatase activity